MLPVLHVFNLVLVRFDLIFLSYSHGFQVMICSRKKKVMICLVSTLGNFSIDRTPVCINKGVVCTGKKKGCKPMALFNFYSINITLRIFSPFLVDSRISRGFENLSRLVSREFSCVKLT